VVTFAQSLIDNGWVTFPSRTSVKVITPPAQVDFAFGPVIGAEKSIQQKTATAAAYSPGNILPMGLSLTCLTSFLGSAPGGLGNLASDVIPLNYISAGQDPGNSTDSGGEGSINWPSYPGGTSGSIVVTGAAIGALNQVVISGSGWGTILNSPTVQVIFRKSGHAPPPVTGIHAVSGQTTVTMPAEVLDSPGEWKVRVAVLVGSVLGVGGQWTLSPASFSFTVPTSHQKVSELLAIDDFVSCGRLAESPRQDAQQLNWLSSNIRYGLDHQVQRHQSLVTAAQGLNLTADSSDTANEVAGYVQNPSLLLSCESSNPINIIDIPSEISKGLIPNCMRVNTSTNRVDQLTKGFLTSGGRFDCATHECFDTPVSLTGYTGQYNNDQFDTFIIDERKNLLTDQMFFALSSYLMPEIPLTTPKSALSEDLFSSPRFFWVAVVSTAYTTQGGSDYPILTFRPIFVTQERPDDLPISNMVDELTFDMVKKIEGSAADLVGGLLGLLGLGDLLDLALVDGGLEDLLAALGNDSPSYEEYGMVFDKKFGDLHALRFMTLDPAALPAASAKYHGPVSDYIGVGPRIVRLVR
jgi:hypothetical protein